MKIKAYALKAIMAERGIKTQQQLAERCGIAQPHISRMLRDPDRLPNLRTIGRLCQALRCQPGDLIEYVPDPN